VIKPPSLDDQSLTPPFAGYIEKNTEVPKLMNDHIIEHIYSSLSSINMEFLATTPLNTSGKAKELDRQELNNFVYQVAYYLVNSILKPAIFRINELRYAEIIGDIDRKAQLPEIAVPTRFDLLSDSVIGEQLREARDAGFDSTIIDALEIHYAAKVFKSDAKIAQKIKTIKELDLFSGKTDQEIADGVLSGIITKEDAVYHQYLNYFVDEAINEDDNFLNLAFSEKASIIRQKAKQKISEETTPGT